MDQFLKQFNDSERVSVPLEQRVMGFGKYKGKTYAEVYNTDKNYVKWIVTNKDDKYIKSVKKYFTERIQEDYSNLP